jgi:hypothetical protein
VGLMLRVEFSPEYFESLITQSTMALELDGLVYVGSSLVVEFAKRNEQTVKTTTSFAYTVSSVGVSQGGFTFVNII